MFHDDVKVSVDRVLGGQGGVFLRSSAHVAGGELTSVSGIDDANG
jgi:hypothetical protein